MAVAAGARAKGEANQRALDVVGAAESSSAPSLSAELRCATRTACGVAAHQLPSHPSAVALAVPPRIRLNDRSMLLVLGALLALRTGQLVLDAVCGDALTSVEHAMSVPSANAISSDALAVPGPLVLQTFVNPQRKVYRLATFTKAQRLRPVGQPSDEASFFPGMQWTALHTKQCDTFVGWLFEPAGDAAARAAEEKRREAAAALRAAGQSSEEERLAALRGTCLTLKKGYWNFEWCHDKEVRQFHAVLTPAANDPNAQPREVRNPDWSLGVADTSGRLFRAADATKGYATRYFVGGQHCDETSRGRRSEVRIHCCATRAHLPAHILSVSVLLYTVTFHANQLTV